MMGNANYHAWLNFNDGEQWLIRIPRQVFRDAPNSLVEYLVASEYATLKFLESTKVPAPKVFDLGLASDPDNAVGVTYLLMECLPGIPYDLDMLETDAENTHSILGQVAEILIQISKHPLPMAGSLIMQQGQNKISQMASNRFAHFGLSGPFHSANDYFTEISEQYLDLIADGQVHIQHPAEAFAFYASARSKSEMFDPKGTATPENPQDFFLKHVDDKGDHILVKDEGIITGVIDWQFAQFAPAMEAFGASYLTANLDWLYSRNAGVTDNDRRLAKELRQRGRGDLARYMEDHELARRFHHGLSEGLVRSEAREVRYSKPGGIPLERTSLWIWIHGLIESVTRIDDGRG